ncbi:MAG: Gfo/Idh/MocA family oxidoreductase [Anaerolineae bacterium]
MTHVRIGIIGLGIQGSYHMSLFKEGKIRRAEVTAVCDIEPEKLAPYSDVKKFTSSEELIRSGAVDAVLIATPHYDHTTIGIDALQHGIHVLVEKPISVHVADAQRLIAAHTDPKIVFAAMFNQRTDPKYIKTRRLIASGELGEIQRVQWTITDWFRPEAYYASGGWRATWRGEGGGVLLNQCPHNLDLLQWICGMPSKVLGICHFGKYHDIEVEDEVTAYFEYPNGATGVFITTTGEAPGTNRLEIVGDRGKVVLEGGKITFTRTEMSVKEFSRVNKATFGRPDVWHVEIPVPPGNGPQHAGITQNFVDAILDGAPLIARAEEGIHSLELANAMLYSTFLGRPVDLPLDAAGYEAQLKKLIATSRFVKKTVAVGPTDVRTSFGS